MLFETLILMRFILLAFVFDLVLHVFCELGLNSSDWSIHVRSMSTEMSGGKASDLFVCCFVMHRSGLLSSELFNEVLWRSLESPKINI